MTLCKDLNRLGASGLLIAYYKGSPAKMLSTVYPEYNWLPWKFGKSIHKYWDDVANKKKYIEWAGNQLGIKELNDWNKVTNQV